MGKRLSAFTDRYTGHFRLKTREITTQAQQYLCGLMQSEKRNMERMVEVVPESDEQSYQHFLSVSPWDERAVLDHVASDADRLLGGTVNSALLIDEVGITKKGTKSVGVSRQYNGSVGKTDNCQVGVFTVLSQGIRAAVVDQRLYLPAAWTADPERCDAVGVPRANQTFKTKPELALEMIRHQRALGVCFAWVGADGLYGNDPAFLRALDDDGERFAIDVHSDQRVYLDDPQPQVPARKSPRGHAPTRLKAQCEPIEVRQWTTEQAESDWRNVELRETTKGKLRVQILHRRVWLWDGREPRARQWHLIVRRELADRNEIK
jgi:SRSO17 transposase